MERTYLALIHKDPGSSFGVTFPDFPGCTSGGDTFEEAREMARESLALCLEGMAAGGECIPPPCSPDVALASEDAHYAIALIVVKALPERTEAEAQAELAAFLASDEYRELFETPMTKEEVDSLPYYDETDESEAVKTGIELRPVIGAEAGRIYAALASQNANGNFAVAFPDLPGCVANGNTLEQACLAARPALTRHLAASGAAIPKPSSASDVLAHPDAADAIALIVVEAMSGRKDEKRQSALEVVSTRT